MKTGTDIFNKFTQCRHSDNFQFSLSALPVNAKRVLYLIMGQIFASKKPEESSLVFEIHAKEYRNVCDIDLRNSYRELENATIALQKSVIYEKVEGEFKVTDAINITRRVRYHHNEGFCSIEINSDVYPYFFELSKAFTTNNLYEVARISDNNVSNLHQVIMKRYSKHKTRKEYETEFVISVLDLKDEMWLFKMIGKKKEYKYKSLPEFKRLLKKLFKQIEIKTSLRNICFEDFKKEGRNVTHLKIRYQHIRDLNRIESIKLNEELDLIESNLYNGII